MALDFANARRTSSASLQWLDYNNQTDSMSLNLNSATVTTLAQADAALNTIATAMRVTNGGITGLQLIKATVNFSYEGSVTVPVHLTALDDVAPTFGHQREYIGVIEVTCTDNYTTGPKTGQPRVRKIKFPAPIDAVLQLADKRFMQEALINITTYEALFQVGGTLAVTTLSDGTQIFSTGIVRAYVQHEASRVTVMQAKDALRIG